MKFAPGLLKNGLMDSEGMHPEREIAIWEKMAEIFGQLCKKRRAGNEVERKQIFREVLERSLKGEPTGVSEKKVPTA